MGMGDVGDRKVKSSSKSSASLGEIFELVRAYAKQETLGPLKGAGRWLLLGVVGSLFLGTGLLVLTIAVLRLLQTEVSVFDGAFTWAPYAIAMAVTIGLAGVSLSRIRKASLGKDK